ncbi:MAG TPA: MTH1187 family thiamine-binding protein [candidate division Zixibacteria bacterium]|nr:MTH1187 family thiamine-binding protein [candidate division Zixibacteria bacterium]
MLLEFSTYPADEESLAGAIAKVIDIIDKSGLPYQTHALGTLVEGEWDELMALVKKCHMKLREDFSRVYTRINIDDREGYKDRITGKIAELEEALGRQIKK